jgi:hypothetical protein
MDILETQTQTEPSITTISFPPVGDIAYSIVRPSVVVNISHFDCIPNRPYAADLCKNCVYGILCKILTMNVFGLMGKYFKGIMSLSLEFLFKVLILR